MIEIALPKKNDLDALATLFDDYRVFYRKTSDVDGAKRFLSERILKKESVIFVARLESELVGFTQLYPLFSSTNMKAVWVLNDLFVAPKHRGKKISKALISKAQEHCKETHGFGISLETEKNNGPGNALYPKMNFSLDEAHNFYFWENPSFSNESE